MREAYPKWEDRYIEGSTVGPGPRWHEVTGGKNAHDDLVIALALPC